MSNFALVKETELDKENRELAHKEAREAAYNYAINEANDEAFGIDDPDEFARVFAKIFRLTYPASYRRNGGPLD